MGQSRCCHPSRRALCALLRVRWSPKESRVKSVRTVCAHDCPDMCSLIASVEDGKIVRVQGDPDHPYTAGFACGKVNRDADSVNSPERIATPLRRSGPKGSGQFTPITWDQALDEI